MSEFCSWDAHDANEVAIRELLQERESKCEELSKGRPFNQRGLEGDASKNTDPTLNEHTLLKLDRQERSALLTQHAAIINIALVAYRSLGRSSSICNVCKRYKSALWLLQQQL